MVCFGGRTSPTKSRWHKPPSRWGVHGCPHLNHLNHLLGIVPRHTSQSTIHGHLVANAGQDTRMNRSSASEKSCRSSAGLSDRRLDATTASPSSIPSHRASHILHLSPCSTVQGPLSQTPKTARLLPLSPSCSLHACAASILLGAPMGAACRTLRPAGPGARPPRTAGRAAQLGHALRAAHGRHGSSVSASGRTRTKGKEGYGGIWFPKGAVKVE